jgi:hypothetical protein
MFNAGAAFEGLSRAATIAVWLAIALLLVGTHSCAAWLGWSAKGNQVAARQLDTVEATVEADREELRARATDAASVITETARQAVAAETEFRELRQEVPHAARPVATPKPALSADCPRCDSRFDARFGRVWNDALAATVPRAPAGADAAPTRSDPVEAWPDAGTVGAALTMMLLVMLARCWRAFALLGEWLR